MKNPLVKLPFNVEAVRPDFPILQQKIHGKPLVYLDNSNTTQKPYAVINTLKDYYCTTNANIHRSVYTLSERATAAYESSRDKLQAFINAKHRQEIIFVKGTTDGINLVAHCFGRLNIGVGDEIIISTMEHHSNIVPWQFLCEQTGAVLKVIPIADNGELDTQAYANLLNKRTKLVAITHVSNVLGTINPLQEIITKAHACAVPVLVDGAQGAPHLPVDVQALDCDFYVFSAHKMYGPTGIGVLYGKERWLEAMPPYQGGGNMIRQVTFAKTTYNELPYKFEAGTANIADVIGFGAAVDYLNQWSLADIAQHEHALLNYAMTRLNEIAGIRFIGTAKQKAGVIAFIFESIHPHDVGTLLNAEGVAVRVGHHCAMPLMERYSVPATIRVSFGLYNTFAEIDVLADSLLKIKTMWQ